MNLWGLFLFIPPHTSTIVLSKQHSWQHLPPSPHQKSSSGHTQLCHFRRNVFLTFSHSLLLIMQKSMKVSPFIHTIFLSANSSLPLLFSLINKPVSCLTWFTEHVLISFMFRVSSDHYMQYNLVSLICSNKLAEDNHLTKMIWGKY